MGQTSLHTKFVKLKPRTPKKGRTEKGVREGEAKDSLAEKTNGRVETEGTA